MLFPFFLIIAIWIKLDSKGPVFYRGFRVGLHGKPFRIFKFRTMVSNAETIGPSSTTYSDNRQTKPGKFLRRYKLDEFSQLINILFGQMSFVGPRPQVEWAVKTYNEKEKKLLSVKPGITDLASIKFHNEGELLEGAEDPDKYYLEIIHSEKMRLALEYVENRSFLMDLKIIMFTLKTIIKK